MGLMRHEGGTGRKGVDHTAFLRAKVPVLWD